MGVSKKTRFYSTRDKGGNENGVVCCDFALLRFVVVAVVRDSYYARTRVHDS